MAGRGNLVHPRESLYPTGRKGRLLVSFPPADFRERYIESGWDCQWDLGIHWRTMCRFIDECGGDELRAARAAYVKARGLRIRSCIGTGSHSDAAWYDKRSRRIGK